MVVAPLRIDANYEQLVPKVSEQDFKELKKSITDNGLFEPIWINSDGVILDGHHRFKAWIGIGKEAAHIPTRIKDFSDKLDERKFVIECNLRRRHLLIHERANLANELHKIEEEQAEKRQSQAGGDKREELKNVLDERLHQKKSHTTTKDKRVKRQRNTAREKAAKKVNLSGETLRKFQYVEQHGETYIVDGMKKGHIKIDKSFKITKKKELIASAKQSLKESGHPIAFKDKAVIHNLENALPILGDFAELSKNIPDNYVDLIFTDPPYKEEDIPKYEELGKIAQRVLKPGGSLITYLGHYALLEIGEKLKKSGLKYWWIMHVGHTGAKAKMWKQNLWVCWKPLLWFVKGEKPNPHSEELYDSIRSEPPDKSKHHWSQSTVEAEYIIRRFTKENDIVFDPFVGSGTTVLAALSLKRKTLSFEKDKDTFAIASQRILECMNDQELR